MKRFLLFLTHFLTTQRNVYKVGVPVWFAFQGEVIYFSQKEQISAGSSPSFRGLQKNVLS